MPLHNGDLYHFVRKWARANYPGATPVCVSIKFSDGSVMRLPIPPDCPDEPDQAGEETRVRITDAERDILDVIEAAGKRLTTAEVTAALEAAGKRLGDSTIAHCLAELCKRKEMLNNRKDGYGRGYGLADWS